MNIRTVEFAGTVAAPTQSPPGSLPEIAFSGRSNVGKSSLINVLLKRTRRKIARVSATPGKTRALNFYRVNDRFFLVDLPGFGYARVPEAVQEKWRGLVEAYLGRSPTLRGVVHVIDARHRPAATDHAMVAYLAELGVRAQFVATKIDKLAQGARRSHLARVAQELELDHKQLLPFSARTGEGRPALLAALEALLVGGGR